MYCSGPVAGIPALLPIIEHLGGVEVVGSGGGALLAAFAALPQDSSTQRRFLRLCDELTRGDVLPPLRSWVRDVSGGAACSLRQWRQRYGPFAAIVFDLTSLRPRLFDCSQRMAVAELLAGALQHETPERKLRGSFINIEEMLPASLIARCLRPAPLLHFQVAAAPTEGRSLADLLNVQTSLLEKNTVHLCWTARLPVQPSSACTWLSPGWSSFCRPRQAPVLPDAKAALPFALALLAWLFVGPLKQ